MTAVVIGVGGIGSQIAQRAHGFGMKVIASPGLGTLGAGVSWSINAEGREKRLTGMMFPGLKI
jgi:phosphoglycerate dehydrogenase-like enzyme